jgi:hypothetical protein
MMMMRRRRAQRPDIPKGIWRLEKHIYTAETMEKIEKRLPDTIELASLMSNVRERREIQI